MTKIIGIGNALVDVLVHLTDDKLLEEMRLQRGGMTHVDEHQLDVIADAIAPFSPQRATGGSASNTIHALAILGDEVGYMGCVGDDEPGHFFVEQVKERGIDAHFTVLHGHRTGIAATLIAGDKERTFATHLGAAALLPADFTQRDFEGYGILHVEGYLVQNHELIERALKVAKEAGLQVSFDLASWNIVRDDHDFITGLLRDYVDIVFANEAEAEAFSRQSDPELALLQLSELCGCAVVKVGRHGAIAMCHGQSLSERILVPVEVVENIVDTTAAGDFFAAGFLHGYIHGGDLRKCLDNGNRMAAQVIRVVGSQVDDETLRRAMATP